MAITFDLSRISYLGAVQLIRPLIPGGVLVGGALALYSDLGSRLLHAEAIGYYSKVGIVVFASYTTGLILTLLVDGYGYLLGYSLGYLAGRYARLRLPEPWKSREWRKAAKKLLGAELAPATEEVPSEAVFDAESRAAEALQDTEQRSRRKLELLGRHIAIQSADFEWFWWHQILQTYFSKPDSNIVLAGYFNSTVHATGWAGIALLALGPRAHWFLWAVCILAIIWGNLWSFSIAGFSGEDPHAVKLTADILRELRRSEKI